MKFLIDENVPQSVADLLEERGYEVLYARDVLLQGEPDMVVAVAADRQKATLVTWNLKDFKKITQRRTTGGAKRLRHMGALCFTCREPQGARRLAQVFDAVEFEFQCASARHDPRVFIDVGIDSFTVHR